MFQLRKAWQQVCLWLYRRLGEKVKPGKKYRTINRLTFYTLHTDKRRVTHPPYAGILAITDRVADVMEQYMMYGNYLQPCLYINHMCHQVHNTMCIILEKHWYGLSESERERVIADCTTLGTYAESLLEVIDPTTIDADILKNIRRSISDLLDAIELDDTAQDDAVRLATQIINPAP